MEAHERMRVLTPLFVLCWLAAPSGGAEPSWPQFRGPNASGVAADGHKLPSEIAPDRNVVWKTPLPPGHSSPAVHGGKIYLTAARDAALLTVALARDTGKVIWEREAPHKSLEVVHAIGSHAQPSPATDGEQVVSFFGSTGLQAYDPDGKLLWHHPLGPFRNSYGAGSSPIICGDRVIINQDHDTDSFLLALDKRTGEVVWKVDRSEFPRGYATPVVWEVDGKKQIVISGTLRAVGYDLSGGQELWTVRGLARIVNMTPTVGGDGILYLPGWTGGADEGDRIVAPPYAELITARDANKNGVFEEDELPEGDIKRRFELIDRNKDGTVSQGEWEGMRRIFNDAQNAIRAVRPGGQGDITASHVLWLQRRFLPYVPSPLWYNGVIFMAKNGGIVCSLDARTGEPLKQGRVAGKADYYSSPVAGDGKIYLLSQRGELSVITAEPQWKEIWSTRFDEDGFATPAIAGGRIYLRTAGHLYAFGAAPD